MLCAGSRESLCGLEITGSFCVCPCSPRVAFLPAVFLSLPVLCVSRLPTVFKTPTLRTHMKRKSVRAEHEGPHPSRDALPAAAGVTARRNMPRSYLSSVGVSVPPVKSANAFQRGFYGGGQRAGMMHHRSAPRLHHASAAPHQGTTFMTEANMSSAMESASDVNSEVDPQRLKDSRRGWSDARLSQGPEGLSPTRRAGSTHLSRGKSSAEEWHRELEREEQRPHVPPARDDLAALMNASIQLDGLSKEGLRTVQRVAREEGIRELKLKQWTGTEPPPDPHPAWTSDFVRRFKYNPEVPEFTSRALVTLVEHAVLAHQRRVNEALSKAARARQNIEQAELAGWERIEEELHKYKTPESERATSAGTLREAVRAFTLRANKGFFKMREALEELEYETALAQSSNSTAMRVVATKLLAQHDASVGTVAADLEECDALLRDVDRTRVLPHAIASALLQEELSAADFQLGAETRRLEGELEAERSLNRRLMLGKAVYFTFSISGTKNKLKRTEQRLYAEQQARQIETRMLKQEFEAERWVMTSEFERQRKADLKELRQHLKIEEARNAELRQLLALTMAQLRTKTRSLAHTEDTLRLTELTMQKEMQDCDQQVAASEEERVWLRKRNAILRSRTIALHAAIHGEDLEHRRELWARGMDTPERALGTWHAGLT